MRLRLASSSGAARTSSRSCLAIAAIRISFAGWEIASAGSDWLGCAISVGTTRAGWGSISSVMSGFCREEGKRRHSAYGSGAAHGDAGREPRLADHGTLASVRQRRARRRRVDLASEPVPVEDRVGGEPGRDAIAYAEEP